MMYKEKSNLYLMRAIPGINEPAAAFAFLALLETIKSFDGDIMQ